MPGISAGRNLLASACNRTKIFILDDDYALSKGTRLVEMAAWLDTDPSVSLVAGCFEGAVSGRLRGTVDCYTFNFAYDDLRREITTTPTKCLGPRQLASRCSSACGASSDICSQGSPGATGWPAPHTSRTQCPRALSSACQELVHCRPGCWRLLTRDASVASTVHAAASTPGPQLFCRSRGCALPLPM